MEQSSDAGSATSVTSSEIALCRPLALQSLSPCGCPLSASAPQTPSSPIRLQTSISYEVAEQRKKMYTAYGGPGSEMVSPGTTELTSVSAYEYSYPDPTAM